MNGRGVISVLAANGSVISFNRLFVSNIRVSQNTNGAVSVSGTVTSLSFVYCQFVSIVAGNYGGGVYLNVETFVNGEDSVIQNSVFVSCSAERGGGIYIGRSGIVIFDTNFSGNTASLSGNDIYFNSSSEQTFYHSSTFELCCSSTSGVRFSLSDDTDLDNLLPNCVILSGQRYISSTNSFDAMNQCLNEANPCRSLGTALSRSVESGDEAVAVTIIGEFDDSATVIGSGVFLYLASVSAESQSL